MVFYLTFAKFQIIELQLDNKFIFRVADKVL